MTEYHNYKSIISSRGWVFHMCALIASDCDTMEPALKCVLLCRYSSGCTCRPVLSDNRFIAPRRGRTAQDLLCDIQSRL